MNLNKLNRITKIKDFKKGLPIVILFFIHFAFVFFPLQHLFYKKIEVDIVILIIDIIRILTVVFCCYIVVNIIKNNQIYIIPSIYILLNSIGVLLKYISEKYIFASGESFNKDIFNYKTMIIFVVVLSLLETIISFMINKLNK